MPPALPRRRCPPPPTPCRPQYDPTKKLETPCFVELKNTSRYQIRVYGIGNESWATASVQATSWTGAAQKGFESNFAYITGANANGSKIPMTAPVATRTHDELNWQVSFFTPASLFPEGTGVPVPTSPTVRIEPFPLSTFAVAEFGGEATEGDYKLASALLKAALVEDGVELAAADDDWAEAWCGFDAPDDLFHRHNEAWIKIILA